MAEENPVVQVSLRGKKEARTAAKGAAEYAASKITPDRYWALYMSYKAKNEGTDAWNRPSFLEFLKEHTTTINVVPDNTRIYQKHIYCFGRYEKLLKSGAIKRFDRADFPLPPTSRSVGDAPFIKLGNMLYPGG